MIVPIELDRVPMREREGRAISTVKSPAGSLASSMRGIIPVLAALLALLTIWWPLTVPLQPFLPTPGEVVSALSNALGEGDFYLHVGKSLRRIVISTAATFLIGGGLAIWMGRNRIAEMILLPWVLIGLAVPGAAVALASVLFLGVAEYASLIAVFIGVVPYVMNVVHQGARGVDVELLQVADVYGFSRSQRMREIIIPAIAPSLMSGARMAFAFSWKVVVVVEALTRPDGIGSQINHFFRLLRADSVVAYTLAFSIVMLTIELTVFRTISRKIFPWREQRTSL